MQVDSFFFFSSRRRHTRWPRDWSSDVCSSDLSSHVSLLDAEDPVRVFAVAAGLGVGTVIQPYWDRQAWDREEDIRATAERLNALAPLASEAGLRVGYHNHEFEARPIFEIGRAHV